MKPTLDELDFSVLTSENVDEILELQERVINSLSDKSLLRRNCEKMFLECVVAPNYTLGVRYGKLLVAVGILYFPTDDEEDLSHLLVGVNTTNTKSANYKLCMVDEKFRGNGLQVLLGKKFEKRAKELDVNLMCATVSPDNVYSERNMLKLGYTLNATLPKYGSIRNLFYKFI